MKDFFAEAPRIFYDVVDKIEKWCEENVWEPFEYWEASDVMDLIESAAWHGYRFMKSNWKELTDANTG